MVESMASIIRPSKRQLFRPLLKVQLKSATRLINITFLVLLAVTLIFNNNFATGSMGTSDGFGLDFYLITPYSFSFILLIPALIMGYDFGKKANDISMNAFIQSKVLNFFVQIVVMLITTVILTIIALGILYAQQLVYDIIGRTNVNDLELKGTFIFLGYFILAVYSVMIGGYLQCRLVEKGTAYGLILPGIIIGFFVIKSLLGIVIPTVVYIIGTIFLIAIMLLVIRKMIEGEVD